MICPGSANIPAVKPCRPEPHMPQARTSITMPVEVTSGSSASSTTMLRTPRNTPAFIGLLPWPWFRPSSNQADTRFGPNAPASSTDMIAGAYLSRKRGSHGPVLFDVWDSQEAFEKFGETLTPILTE